MYKMMTPGPTMTARSVLQARSREFVNPDVDPDFCEEYHRVCTELAGLLDTRNEVFILGGEGILSLEAACASLTEPGDRVLVIDNGIFGRGFADFVKIYGGDPVLYTVDYHRPVEAEALRQFLEGDHDFKYATIVHCDTPSGVLNDIGLLCPMLKEYGILTVVDSVAAMFGEEVHVDEWRIDIICGGSQKALSARWPRFTAVFCLSWIIIKRSGFLIRCLSAISMAWRKRCVSSGRIRTGSAAITGSPPPSGIR